MSKKILLVDDDPTVRKLIATRLAVQNYDVLTAEDGVKALDILKKTPLDLILLDIKMPKMDGYTFLLEIKKAKDITVPPVIVCTSKEDMKEIFKIEGVNDYLVKPLQEKELLEKIKKHIG